MPLPRLRLAALTALLVLALPACVRSEQVEPVASDAGGASETPAAAGGQEGGEAGGGRVSIATGGTGGVYFVYGGGIAEQITQNLEGYEATAEVTSASVDNMLLIGDGRSDVAFSLSDTAADAVNGAAQFEGEPVEAQALANLYVNYTHLVAQQGSGIDSVESLRGRRVSVGSPGSGTEVIALRILEAAGLDPDADIARQQLGVQESVQGVRDGNLDAFFWSGGLPTGAVTDLASTNPITLVPLADYVAPLQEAYSEVYQATSIPAETYPGAAEAPTVGVANYLVVSPSMDEQLAFDLTRLLFDQQQALEQVHPEAANLDLETAQQVDPLELHPGAQRYYDETG